MEDAGAITGGLEKTLVQNELKRAVAMIPCRGVNRAFVKTRVAEMFRRKTL
jgi:hypothetical protein